MKAILNHAAATLPESKRASTTMAEMASQILACAAKGERDSATLKIAALLAVVECSRYSHAGAAGSVRARLLSDPGGAPMQDLKAQLEKLRCDAEDCSLVAFMLPPATGWVSTISH
jgi:hypothetical protein